MRQRVFEQPVDPDKACRGQGGMNCTGTSFTMAAMPRRMAQYGCTTVTRTAVGRAFPAAAFRCTMLVAGLGKEN